jgi:hypothetical protein
MKGIGLSLSDRICKTVGGLARKKLGRTAFVTRQRPCAAPDAHRRDEENYKSGQPMNRRMRRKLAHLYEKRLNKGEPLELELVVLFGTIALILLVPWLIHDFRFIFIIPVCLLVVPGLGGVFFQAVRELLESTDNAQREGKARADMMSDKKTLKIRTFILSNKPDNFAGNMPRQRSKGNLKPRRNVVTFLRKIPFFKDWGGFL